MLFYRNSNVSLYLFEKFRENNIQDETTMATFINEKGGIDEFMKKLESQGTEEKDH